MKNLLLKFLKNICISSLVVFFFISTVELSTRGLHWIFPDFPGFIEYREFTHKKIKEKLNDFEQRMFCDFIHKTEKGHQLTTKIILENLDFSKHEIIWAMGGSTTEGKECNVLINWVDNLSERFPEKNFFNHGRSGMNSDYSLSLFDLKPQVMPDLVIWGHWFNEFLIEGNSKDPNFDQLKTNYSLENNNQQYFSNVRISRIHYTLYRKSLAFRTLHNILNNLLRKAFPTLLDHQGHRDVPKVLTKAFNGNKKKWIDYSLDNYAINLEKLYKLSLSYNFKVVLIYHAHPDNYYEEFSPPLNPILEGLWYPRLRKLMQEKARLYGWKFIDLKRLFENHSQNKK